MTRKDFVALAAALASVRPRPFDHYPAAKLDAWCKCVIAVGDTLAKENARFDQARFWVACNEKLEVVA
jgi:hypothetical protein